MQVISGWLEYLDQMNIRYSHSVHNRAQTAYETANADKVPAHEFAKTVVFYSGGNYGLAVVPADEFVDLAKLSHLLGITYLRLADEAELALLFPDCEVGAMPPFSESCDMPVVVDTALVQQFIAFTIGTHRDTVRMSFEDFRRLAKPTVASICIRRAA